MRILYIDIDTLRPDHLSCYGYHRETSPNIDRIAENAVRFEKCYVSDAPCLPSRSACWTGRFGIHTGVVNHGGAAADPRSAGKDRNFFGNFDRLNFVSVLRLFAKMHTVSISPFAERHAAWWFQDGFMETYNTGKMGGETADEVVPIAIDWLDRNQDKDNWFLHVNVWDPHTDFNTPAEYGEPFENDPPPSWLTQEMVDHHHSSYGPHSAQETYHYKSHDLEKHPRMKNEITSVDDFTHWINGYDTGIHYADMWVGKLLDKLEEMGILEETAIIVSSDHGENHGELGIFGDHHTADHITSRVPYILKFPGLTDSGSVDNALHYQADLSATVLGLLGMAPPPKWDGISFAEALKEGKEEGRDEVIISNCAWTCQRSVVWDNWLAMQTYHTAFHPFPEYMLFDLEEDPHETTNLARTRPDIMAEGMKRLGHWQVEMLKDSDHGDPLYTVLNEGGSFHANNSSNELTNYIKRLKETDREYYAELLTKKKGDPIPEGSPYAAALEPGQDFLSSTYKGEDK